jgi:hypothetical protein
VSVLVQRREITRASWSSLGTWLAPGTTTFTDEGVVDAIQYEYRLRGRNALGIQTALSNALLTEAV